MQTLSMTNLTPAGGLFMAFTTAISVTVKVLSAACAFNKIGNASDKFASHSAFISAALPATSCLK